MKIYTDGGCKPNPGLGACAIVVVEDDDIVFEKAFYKRDTTNNRMELSAVILAAEYALKYPDNYLTIICDSQYVQKGITQWIHNWKKNNWKTTSKTDVLNKDLWISLDLLIEKLRIKYSYVDFQWIKGHDDNVYNNRVDSLCTQMINKYIL